MAGPGKTVKPDSQTSAVGRGIEGSKARSDPGGGMDRLRGKDWIASYCFIERSRFGWGAPTRSERQQPNRANLSLPRQGERVANANFR